MVQDDSYGGKNYESFDELFNRFAAEQWKRAHCRIMSHRFTYQAAEDILQDSFERMMLALRKRTLSEVRSMDLPKYLDKVIENQMKSHWGEPGQNILAGPLAAEKN